MCSSDSSCDLFSFSPKSRLLASRLSYLITSPCPMVHSVRSSLSLSFTLLADRLIDLALASVPLVKNEPVTLCCTVNHLICLIHLFSSATHTHTHTHTWKLMSGKTWTQEVQPSELFYALSRVRRRKKDATCRYELTAYGHSTTSSRFPLFLSS